jgi:lipopolysaccharide transport system permease protein
MSQTFRIRPASEQPLLDLGELWQYRHLLRVLVWRTLRVRYRQMAIGVGWAILQPALLALIFTVIFGHFASMPTNGQPYPLFVLSGLFVWLFVSQAFSQASGAIISNPHLITKIYFPRVILVLAVMISTLIDFLCAFLLLLAIMIWYRTAPSIGALFFIPMLVLAMLTVLGLSLWVSALNVRYRDIGHLVPFILLIWMFLSPIIYPSSLLPAHYSYLYALNPLVAVIDTARWAFAGGQPPAAQMVAVSWAVALFLGATGLWYFRRQEASFADVV